MRRATCPLCRDVHPMHHMLVCGSHAVALELGKATGILHLRAQWMVEPARDSRGATCRPGQSTQIVFLCLMGWGLGFCFAFFTDHILPDAAMLPLGHHSQGRSLGSQPAQSQGSSEVPTGPPQLGDLKPLPFLPIVLTGPF